MLTGKRLLKNVEFGKVGTVILRMRRFESIESKNYERKHPHRVTCSVHTDKPR